MRVLILIVGLLILFAIVGWVTFNNDSGRSSINLETHEIREDTGELMQKGSELLDEAGDDVAPVDDDEPEAADRSTP